jgi:hypothetical protein
MKIIGVEIDRFDARAQADVVLRDEDTGEVWRLPQPPGNVRLQDAAAAIVAMVIRDKADYVFVDTSSSVGKSFCEHLSEICPVPVCPKDISSKALALTFVMGPVPRLRMRPAVSRSITEEPAYTPTWPLPGAGEV